ncbi:unnamed protein product [Enterobius vermicularis]|uniref:Longin domain-containing protein n=1 Tax=Enterobius vermicularis TaxID=51028 RepID=A0A0N4VIW2_ENTVE|nr:unnamed protein product [Enterobius vermicularis]
MLLGCGTDFKRYFVVVDSDRGFVFELVSNAEQESQVSPQLLINLINTYLTKVKKQLYNKGVGLHLNSQGLPIDFSARPVDPIFRNAREQLDSIREYRDTGSPISNHMAVDLNRRLSPSLKEAEIVESAAERLQQSAIREREASRESVDADKKDNGITDKTSQSVNVDLHHCSEVVKEKDGGEACHLFNSEYCCEESAAYFRRAECNKGNQAAFSTLTLKRVLPPFTFLQPDAVKVRPLIPHNIQLMITASG